MVKTTTIKELVFDNKNSNKHTEQGLRLLEKSLQKLGAGRSILIDKDNKIIAGNGVVEVAAQIGLEKLKIIETDGTEIIAVKRKDLSLDSPQGREMAIADNQTAKVGIDFDTDAIYELSEFYNIDFQKEWELNLKIFEKNINSPNIQFSPSQISNITDNSNDDDDIEEYSSYDVHENKKPTESPYTNLIKGLQYQPKNEKPPLNELYDASKYYELIREIEKSNLDDNEKTFLSLAATRFIEFNFDKIADYYAHSNKETQSYMEKLALVIIDFDDAINNGIINMTKKLHDIITGDNTDD